VNTRFDAELSRLAFEDRLIEFCEDEHTPLLDRIRLLGIVGERIDVFFMTRVGRLKRLIADERDQRRTHHAAPHEQLAIITVEANRIMRRAYTLVERLLAQLEDKGAGIDPWQSLGEDDRAHLRNICGRKLDALVNPIVVENDRAFPHVRNLRPALLASARRKGEPCHVVVELPADLPRLVPLQRKNRFVQQSNRRYAATSRWCSHTCSA
jgi:polyphosphate kinase